MQISVNIVLSQFFSSLVWTYSTRKRNEHIYGKKLLPYSCVSVVLSQQISVRYCSPQPYQSADRELDTPGEKNGEMSIVNEQQGSDDSSQLTLKSLRKWKSWGHRMGLNEENKKKITNINTQSKCLKQKVLPALWTWSIRCWHPGDTARRWESRCRPSYCPSQSVSQHHWQTPANASSHSSSLSCPIRRHILLLILFFSFLYHHLTIEIMKLTGQNHKLSIWVHIF